MHCICTLQKLNSSYVFIKLWLLKFVEKTRFLQVVETGQDSIYKSSQLSAVK